MNENTYQLKIQFSSSEEKDKWISAFKEVGHGTNLKDPVGEEKQKGVHLVSSLLEKSIDKLKMLVSKDRAIQKNKEVMAEITMLTSLIDKMNSFIKG